MSTAAVADVPSPLMKRTALVDTLTLVAIFCLSVLPYIGRLGLYSDDLDLIYRFEAAVRNGHTAIGGTLADYGVRPVQGLYLGGLFTLFGRNPLAFHILNSAVIASSIALFYSLLLRLGLRRAEAFAAALIFSLLPQLSTVRVWFAAFQIPLSMAFALVALHALLSSKGTRRFLWATVSLLATLLSVGAYEIFAPIIAGFALVLRFCPLWLIPSDRGDNRDRHLACVMVVIGALTADLVKLFSYRAAPLTIADTYVFTLYEFLRPDYDWRVDYGLNILAGLNFYTWVQVRDWAIGLSYLGTGRPGVLTLAVAFAVAALVWWRLQVPEAARSPPKEWLRLLMLGLATIILGLATFLIAASVQFSPAGIENRMLVAAALGFAMVLGAALAALRSFLPVSGGRAFFSVAVVAVALCSLARTEMIEKYWTETPALQQRVLTAAQSDLNSVPAGATVILDGVCPYHGPAIVFESDWDFAGALSHRLDRKIAADVVSRRMTLEPTALTTSIYDIIDKYPYGPTLFVYNPNLHSVVPLPDLAAAKAYFSRSDRVTRCPIGYVGHGVPI